MSIGLKPKPLLLLLFRLDEEDNLPVLESPFNSIIQITNREVILVDDDSQNKFQPR
jgi:hypothetical protein